MKILIETIRYFWEEKPLRVIVWIAVMLRLVSVIFAKGWGMLDDHFLVIEVAQSWVDGGNHNHWLPWSPDNEGPSGHTFLYAGIHFLMFTFFKWIHLTDPQVKMLIVRFLHAAFSLITVVLGYRIAEKLSDKSGAKLTGILLAAFWFMPWLSVRNLVEVVAIPLLLISTWMILEEEKKRNKLSWFMLAGFVAGVAFSVRYQTVFYAGGMGLALLFQKKIREGFIFGAGYFVAVALIQGGIDLVIWGIPFAEFAEYVQYNIINANNYITGEWYKYIILLAGVLIPPISIFLFAGFFKNWKKNLILFLPTFIFIAFHSYFPNKQERFIFTIVPSLILLGVIGWQQIFRLTPFLQKHKNWIKGSWIFFWIINLILLVAITGMYSKKARVEAMTWLGQYPDVKSVILENTNGTDIQIMPQFYMNQWIKFWKVSKKKPLDSLPDSCLIQDFQPRFVLLFREENLDRRVDSLKKYFPEITFDYVAEPGNIDKIMTWLNPRNKNEAIYIYRNKHYFPESVNRIKK